MFKIAVQTGDLDLMFGIDEAYRMIREAGFDAVDANVDHLFPYRDIVEKKIPEVFADTTSEKDLLAYFKPYADASRKYGLDNYQAHAPFPSFHPREKDDEWNDFLLTVLKKTIMGCAVMDCHNLIIHPFFMDYDHMLPRDEEWKLNIDRYSELAKVAARYDVVINLENMFVGRKGKMFAAICNESHSAAAYVDTLNEMAGEKRFGFCLDTGHALLAGLEIRRLMNDLGPRITCFHVHDNDGVSDCHQAPYTGKMDWDRFVLGLKDIGFNSTLSFETFNAVRTTDRELIPATLKYIAECGRLFDRRASS